MNNNTLKTQICDALAAWIRQRPGLEFGNYGNITSYRAEARTIARDKRDAETLLVAVRHNDSITAEMLLEAAKHSFSGRLRIIVRHKTRAGVCSDPLHEVECLDGNEVIEIEYDTGQYWCTEYRKAAAAVLAGALWTATRDAMPEPTYKQHGSAADHPMRTEALYDGKSAGDWLRKHFRAEFGSKMQKRWFD